MIYLDSCALIKLIIPEPESEALFQYLDNTNDPLVTSELSTVEVHRALIRTEVSEQTHAVAEVILDNFIRLPMSAIVDAAAKLPGKYLRSLSALHLASATQLPLTAFLSYDKRLQEAARDAGLNVHAPGRAKN